MRTLFDRWGATALLSVLVLALPIWAALVADAKGATLSPNDVYAVAPALLLAGVALGALVRRRLSVDIVAAVLVGVTALLILVFPVIPGPARAPMVYPNANAALAIQLIGLAGVVLARARGHSRWLLWGAAFSGYLVVLLNKSRVGAAVGLMVLMAMLVSQRLGGRTRLLAGVAGVLLAGLSAWLVAAAAGTSWTRRLPFPDPTRLGLWKSALSIWRGDRLIGAGPGAFVREVPLAGDPDTASAHSAFLQVGAETGIVGAGLLMLAALAGLWWAARGAWASAVVAITAWTALSVHSLVDHLVDFGPVMLAAGLVLGWSSGSEELDVSHREDP